MENVISDVKELNFDYVTLKDLELLNNRGVYVFGRAGEANGFEFKEELVYLRK